MSSSRGARGWVPAVAVALAATALMARRVLPIGFVGQDTWPILLTSRVASLADLLRTLSHELMDGRYPADFYRPIFGLSIALDHAFWGLDPLGYQITSLLLYGAGGFVVFLVARRLLGEASMLGALAAMTLYLLHPAHVEVVPVPARRPDLLCWLFLGLALALPSGRNGRTSVLAALAGFLAMMSKEAGLLAPGLALIAAIVASERRALVPRLREALSATIPLWIALAVALALRVAVLGGIGGHGANVRDASLDRIPNTVLASWALLVQPQPVIRAGVAGSPWVAAWSVLFLGAAVVLASRSWGRGRLRGFLPPLLWLLVLAGTYAASGGIQAWYLVLPLACFSLLLGAAADAALRLPRGAAVVLWVLIAAVAFGPIRYSPLLIRYDAWETATRAGNDFFDELAARVDSASPGERIEAPPMPSWVPATPGRPGGRGASVLAPYSVQAWLELRHPSMRIRVSRDPAEIPAPDEILVVADRVRPGFELGPR